MAKQNVSILERHVEKAVVGLTGVLLLGAVVMYGIMQPNTQQAGSEVVSPSTIDERVVEAAEKVKRAITTADPEPVKIESAVPRLEQYRDVLASGGLLGCMPGIVAWQPPVPDVGRIVPQEGDIQLAQVAKPTKPVVTAGRSTLELFPPVEFGQEEGSSLSEEEIEGYQQPVGWSSVTVTFDLASQKLAMKRAGYGPEFDDPYLVGLELQRREQRYDGSWSDDDWQIVPQTRRFRIPEPPVITLEKQADRMVATAASREEAQNHWQKISDPEVQVELMRPLFPTPLNGNGWKPVTIAGVDLTKLDNELLETDVLQPSKLPLRDYGYADIEKKFKKIEPTEQVKQWKQQIDAARKQKEWEKAKEIAELIVGFASAKEADRKDAEKWVAEFEQAIENERMIELQRDQKDKVKPPPPPEIKEARRSEIQQVWAHDANVSSLHGGRTYQYRVRAKLHNNYYGNPGFLKNAEDATKPYVLGEWSEAAEPITIPPSAEFYVAKGDQERKSARVGIYQWAFGVWVDNNFDITPGERISGQAYKAVPNDPKRAILFNTGSTALDLDFDRLILEEKSAGKGDFESKPAQTVALVYLDEQGNVRERLALLDKKSPEQTLIKEQLFDEKAAAKAGQQSEETKEKEPGVPQGTGKTGRGGRGGGGKRG